MYLYTYTYIYIYTYIGCVAESLVPFNVAYIHVYMHMYRVFCGKYNAFE